MPRTDADLAGIIIESNDSVGLYTRVTTKGNLDTTASKFAVGCIMVDENDGKVYRNNGTVAVPTWDDVNVVDDDDIGTSTTAIPTDDGTGTGTLNPGGQIVLVTAANTAHWITLPAPVPGTLIRLVSTNTTGYEIRSSAPATIGINGGTGSNAESAIAGAAGTVVQLLCVSATNWIAWSRVAAGTLSVVQVAAA